MCLQFPQTSPEDIEDISRSMHYTSDSRYSDDICLRHHQANFYVNIFSMYMCIVFKQDLLVKKKRNYIYSEETKYLLLIYYNILQVR